MLFQASISVSSQMMAVALSQVFIKPVAHRQILVFYQVSLAWIRIVQRNTIKMNVLQQDHDVCFKSLCLEVEAGFGI